MYKWIFLQGNKRQEEELIKSLGISPLLARLLVNRGITEKKLAEEFLNPFLDNLYNPFHFFPQLENALDYIIKLRNLKKKILIYGDYDVDGITSTTLLLKVLRNWGWDVDYYIPHRLIEGYGLKKETLEKLYLSKYSLIITVDCGINNREEVDFLKKNGLDVIITDHHIPLTDLPNALLILNPHLNNYPCSYLSGVGVVFKFLQALSEKIGEKLYSEEGIFELVSLGTLGDQVDLKSENRIFVKYGLNKISETKLVGLKALIKKAGLGGYSFLETRDILFYIVPRLNAIGRLREVKDAVELILSQDEEYAENLANVLENENRERQRIKEEVTLSANEEVERYFEKEGEDVPIIILSKEDWHKGVLGISASELAEKYNRPVLLGKIEGDYIIGSGRSIEDVDIFDFMTRLLPFLSKFGGHKSAIGFSIKRAFWDEFYRSAIKLSRELWKDLDLMPKIKIDKEIDIKDINSNLLADIEKLSPFGPGNEEPCFLISNSTIQELSSENEKKFNIKIVDLSGSMLSLTGFGLTKDLTNRKEELMDMVVRIYKGNFGGESFYRFYLEDFKVNMKNHIKLNSVKKRKFRYLLHLENDVEKNSVLEKIKKKRNNIIIITPSWNQSYWEDKSLTFISPWEIENKMEELRNSSLILWEDAELILRIPEFMNYYCKLIRELPIPIFFLTLLGDERVFLELSKMLNIRVVKYPSKVQIPSLRDLRFSKNREKEENFFKKVNAFFYPSNFPFFHLNHLVFAKPPILSSELRRWIKISKHAYLFFGKDEIMEGYKRSQEFSLNLNPLERDFFRKSSQDFLIILQKARLSEIYSLLFQYEFFGHK
ncbi:MAG: single-stranded-DNA-specific exonuclease RecJ [Dictyoglomus sp.]|nr:single-stranded-DNA-specific exonuclease RecJ [Dictyoglomus sp.]MCX7942767.1 single-stranded-DNA-specific exonuclease RecJ [Dictyoglomaceae bacterium]MDW8188425.1 single-stranded-DNA-specific exonuclease RecJ [Dictyoglomus sp.]